MYEDRLRSHLDQNSRWYFYAALRILWEASDRNSPIMACIKLRMRHSLLI